METPTYTVKTATRTAICFLHLLVDSSTFSKGGQTLKIFSYFFLIEGIGSSG